MWGDTITHLKIPPHDFAPEKIKGAIEKIDLPTIEIQLDEWPVLFFQVMFPTNLKDFAERTSDSEKFVTDIMQPHHRYNTCCNNNENRFYQRNNNGGFQNYTGKNDT